MNSRHIGIHVRPGFVFVLYALLDQLGAGRNRRIFLAASGGGSGERGEGLPARAG